MRKSENFGLNLPEAEDSYNVADFSDNFDLIDGLLSQKFAEIENAQRTSIVTGIMTSNGEMNLGFQPRAVFVFGTTGGMSTGTSANIGVASRMFAMAIPEFVQHYNGNIVLQVNQTGFRTLYAVGGIHSANSVFEVSAAAPLRYIAFR